MSKNFSILMKEGHKGEAPTMDNTRGIVVPTISGQQFLVYPSYKSTKMLEREKIDDYKGHEYSEFEALYLDSCKEETDLLLECGSPAAQHVRQYGLDLPNLQMAVAIIRHCQQINEAAAKIAGADQITDNSYVWTCCRCYRKLAWSAYGDYGHVGGDGMILRHLAVPVTPLFETYTSKIRDMVDEAESKLVDYIRKNGKYLDGIKGCKLGDLCPVALGDSVKFVDDLEQFPIDHIIHLDHKPLKILEAADCLPK